VRLARCSCRAPSGGPPVPPRPQASGPALLCRDSIFVKGRRRGEPAFPASDAGSGVAALASRRRARRSEAVSKREGSPDIPRAQAGPIPGPRAQEDSSELKGGTANRSGGPTFYGGPVASAVARRRLHLATLCCGWGRCGWPAAAGTCGQGVARLGARTGGQPFPGPPSRSRPFRAPSRRCLSLPAPPQRRGPCHVFPNVFQLRLVFRPPNPGMTLTRRSLRPLCRLAPLVEPVRVGRRGPTRATRRAAVRGRRRREKTRRRGRATPRCRASAASRPQRDPRHPRHSCRAVVPDVPALAGPSQGRWRRGAGGGNEARRQAAADTRAPVAVAFVSSPRSFPPFSTPEETGLLNGPPRAIRNVPLSCALPKSDAHARRWCESGPMQRETLAHRPGSASRSPPELWSPRARPPNGDRPKPASGCAQFALRPPPLLLGTLTPLLRRHRLHGLTLERNGLPWLPPYLKKGGAAPALPLKMPSPPSHHRHSLELILFCGKPRRTTR